MNRPLFLNKENQKIRKIVSPSRNESFGAILNDIPLQVNNRIFISRGIENREPQKMVLRKQSSLIPVVRNFDNRKNFSFNERMAKDKPIEKSYSQKQSRNNILLRKAKSPIPIKKPLPQKPTRNTFYNELYLAKAKTPKNKSIENFKTLAIFHFESLAQVRKKKNGRPSFFLGAEFDECLEYFQAFSFIVLIITDDEIFKDIEEMLEKRGMHYHFLYKIKLNQGLIPEGNVVLNYSQIFEDLGCVTIEEVIIFQTYDEDSFVHLNNDQIPTHKLIQCFENKLAYIHELGAKRLKLCYLNEKSLPNSQILSLFKSCQFGEVPLQNFIGVFSSYQQTYSRKFKNFRILQNIQEFKKSQPFPPQKTNLDDLFLKSQNKLRKTFFDYLIELKKHPRFKNMLIGPMIDSLLNRNAHIFKHILRVQSEKEALRQSVLSQLEKVSLNQEGEANGLEKCESFIISHYKNRLE